MKTTFFFNSKKINFWLFSLIFSVFSFSSFAGSNTSFGGEWALNKNKGNISQARFVSEKLNIVQTDNELSVDRIGTNQNGDAIKVTEKYTLDGKESVNKGSNNREKKSVVKWSEDGKSIIITSISVFERDGNTMEIKSVEIWKLSDEGNSLIIDSSSTSPRGERKNQFVYEKVIAK